MIVCALSYYLLNMVLGVHRHTCLCALFSQLETGVSSQIMLGHLLHHHQLSHDQSRSKDQGKIVIRRPNAASSCTAMQGH